jgi:hypothetical protein
VPLLPLVPDAPDVPDEPLVPVEPLVPLEPAVSKSVPTPAAHAVISIYAPLADPPCSKILNLF